MTFSIATIIQILQAVIAAMPSVISTAEELYTIGQKVFETLNGRVPTDQEIADLQTQIDADVAEALTPIPDDPPAAS